MPRAFGLLFRLIIFFPLAIGLILIAGTAFNFVIEPSYEATNDPAWDGAERAFGDADSTNAENAIMHFTAVSMMGLLLAAAFWMIYGDLRSDTRQRRTDFRPPP